MVAKGPGERLIALILKNRAPELLCFAPILITISIVI